MSETGSIARARALQGETIRTIRSTRTTRARSRWLRARLDTQRDLRAPTPDGAELRAQGERSLRLRELRLLGRTLA
jgi:hypothetical protein